MANSLQEKMLLNNVLVVESPQNTNMLFSVAATERSTNHKMSSQKCLRSDEYDINFSTYKIKRKKKHVTVFLLPHQLTQVHRKCKNQ